MFKHRAKNTIHHRILWIYWATIAYNIYLPIENLCSVAETCIKFSINIKPIASLQFNNFISRVADSYGTERLLRNFGTKIKSLHLSVNISDGMRNDALSIILVKYGSSSNCQLEKLISKRNMRIYQVCPYILRPTFQRLKQLKFYPKLQTELSTTHIKELAKCETLTKLSFIKCAKSINDSKFGDILVSVTARKSKKK